MQLFLAVKTYTFYFQLLLEIGWNKRNFLVEKLVGHKRTMPQTWLVYAPMMMSFSTPIVYLTISNSKCFVTLILWNDPLNFQEISVFI